MKAHESKIKIIAMVILLLFIAVSVQAQSFNKLKKRGDRDYENYLYSQAIDNYEAALAIEADTNVMLRLAESYRLTRKMDKAEEWYSQAEVLGAFDEMYLFHNADHLLNYANVLKYNDKYQEAKVRYDQYERHAKNGVGARLSASIAMAPKFKRDSALVEITSLSFNTEFADFSPTFYKTGLAFVSSRPPAKFKGSKDYWSGDSYLDIFYIKNFTEYSASEAESFSNNINSPYHEGPATFSTSGGRIYFTRSNVVRNRQRRGKDGALQFSIFYADWQDRSQDWDYEEKFEYSSDDYSAGHPSLSQSGDRLYFASDMEGGYGGFDLYYCKREGISWSDPVNLGPWVNTPGNEVYPYVSEMGTLYFSSDVLAGLGGYDIFSARLGKDEQWGSVRNLGYPINTSRDDFGLIMREDGKVGYLSSNRLNGKGSDDIYQVRIKEAADEQGVVVNPVVEDLDVLTEWEPLEEVIEVVDDVEDIAEEVGSEMEVIAEEAVEEPGDDVIQEIASDEEENDGGFAMIEEEDTEHKGGFEVVLDEKELEEIMDVEDELERVREREKEWREGDKEEEKIEAVVVDEEAYSKAKDKTVINGEEVTWGELLDDNGKLKTSDISRKIAKVEVPGINYRVQVGAYSNPKWFDEGRFQDMGGVETYDMNDNIIRYVIPRIFSNISAAEALREETVKQGIQDAFIVPFDNSKRITMDEALFRISKAIE